MKNIIRLFALALCLLLTASFMVGCGKDTEDNNAATEAATQEVTTAAPVEPIGEDAAKEIVWADLSIQESAAENLTVELKDNAYVIAFDWSGFDYQYTIDAGTGEILEILFDGSPLW